SIAATSCSVARHWRPPPSPPTLRCRRRKRRDRRPRRRAAASPTSCSSWATTSAGSTPAPSNPGPLGTPRPTTPRTAKEGAMFTDWYGQQSCTAGRAAFITGQSPIRTGLTKVGLPGAELGLGPLDPSVADVLKTYGYATGQFGKNHLGDRDEHLPTAH